MVAFLAMLAAQVAANALGGGGQQGQGGPIFTPPKFGGMSSDGKPKYRPGSTPQQPTPVVPPPVPAPAGPPPVGGAPSPTQSPWQQAGNAALQTTLQELVRSLFGSQQQPMGPVFTTPTFGRR